MKQILKNVYKLLALTPMLVAPEPEQVKIGAGVKNLWVHFFHFSTVFFRR